MSKTFIRRILLILCGIALGVNIYNINANNLVGNKLPMPFGYGMAVVLSGSMEPAYSVNDLIVVKEAEEYAVGDVVVFQDAHDLVVHRIVELSEEEVRTQGDANNVADEPVDISAIKGAVIFSVPAVGKIVNILKSPVGIIVLLAIALLLLEMPYITEKKTHNEELEKIREEIRRLKEED